MSTEDKDSITNDSGSADRGARDSDRSERHDRSLERNEHRERGRSIVKNYALPTTKLLAMMSDLAEASHRAERHGKPAKPRGEPGSAGGAVAPDAGGTSLMLRQILRHRQKVGAPTNARTSADVPDGRNCPHKKKRS